MSTPEILRLRCVRCGDWHEREVGDPYLPELCLRCFDKYLDSDVERFVDRYWRGAERHPTMIALKQAWAEYTKDWPKDLGSEPF